MSKAELELYNELQAELTQLKQENKVMIDLNQQIQV